MGAGPGTTKAIRRQIQAISGGCQSSYALSTACWYCQRASSIITPGQ